MLLKCKETYPTSRAKHLILKSRRRATKTQQIKHKPLYFPHLIRIMEQKQVNPKSVNGHHLAAAVVPPPSTKITINDVKDATGKWGEMMGEAVKKSEDITGNVWQHLRTGPCIADSAMGRIAHGTKVIAEGGYGKIFRQTFDVEPEEQLEHSYACYLSTSAGPIMGILYLSTIKLGFCSNNPLSYEVGDQTEWSYYKVIIPLSQLKSVNPSTSSMNPAEKYIQITSIDNYEFWFMGFMNYDNAVTILQEVPHDTGALQL